MNNNKQESFQKNRKILAALLVMLLSLNMFAQKSNVTGHISDATTNEPLIGVTIVEKGTLNGTISDTDGNFSISVTQGSTIVFSYVGYESVEQRATSSMKITMQEKSRALDEVVVVGFGTQKKVNLTGAVGVATAKDIESRPVANTVQALQGLVPGLNILNSGNGGELNGTKTINIRGTSTISSAANGSPLILIDGMEGNINTINPQDIDNISVLKDAAASSIYGSRAPFGVILITTKKGKAGRPVINYNNSLRLSTPILMPKMMSSWEYVNFYDDAMFNKNNTHYYSEEYKQKVKDYYDGKLAPNNVAEPQGDGKWNYDFTWGNVDWLQEYFRDWAGSQEHNASVSGGAEKINYYLSTNYLTQSGFIRYGTDHFKRYNITGKISAQLTNYLKVDYINRFARTDYNRPGMLYSAFYNNVLRRCRPVRPIYDPNGYYMSDINYIEALQNGGRHTEQNDGLAQQMRLTVTPIKNWNIIGEMNVKTDNNWTHWDNKMVYSHYANDPEKTYVATLTGPSQNQLSEYSYKSTYLNPNIYTNYNISLDKHNIAFTGGVQNEQQRYRTVRAQRADMISTELPVLNLTTNNTNFAIEGAFHEWANTGFFGRVNYDYDGRYLLEGNLRYDGSSRFRRENRWILTPSFSAGWNIAREKFWESWVNSVSVLKIRASYGTLANQNTTSLYPTYQTVSVRAANGSWLINNARPNTAEAPTLVSTSLTWEKIRTSNIGLDVSSLRGRLTGSFDYFVRTTSDMMGKGVELPAVLGADVPSTNNTDMRTFGWELSIGWRDNIRDFNYGVRLNLADSQSRITRFGNPTGSLSTYVEGELLGNIYGYTTIGIAKTDEEMQAHLATMTNGAQDGLGNQWQAGDIMYADLNGDGKISNGSNTIYDMGDMKKIGNSTPRYTVGFIFDASWKNIDFQMFWQGVLKRDYWPGDMNMTFWGVTDGEWWSTAFKDHLDYFREAGHPLGENLNAYYPRPVFNTKNNKVQTRYLQNAAYMRLKNIQLGYTLPKKIAAKILLQNLRIFFSGENLLTITKLSKTMDPETIGIGIQDNAQANSTVYPLASVYSLGLSVNF